MSLSRFRPSFHDECYWNGLLKVIQLLLSLRLLFERLRHDHHWIGMHVLQIVRRDLLLSLEIVLDRLSEIRSGSSQLTQVLLDVLI